MTVTERQLQRLDRLADAGLEVALAVERRAREAGPEEDLNALAMAHARVARAVRLTGMLQSKLIEALKAPAAPAPATPVIDERYEASEERKLRVERAVGRVAMAEKDDPDRAERLLEDARDRLDWDDVYGDVLTRPMSDVLAQVCRDLGLDPDWDRLADESWALEELRSGPVGAPLRGRRPSPPAGAGEQAFAEQRLEPPTDSWGRSALTPLEPPA